MRTVTFSNAKVAERVNSRFVPVWFNRGQGFHNCEKRTEDSIFARSADCYPTKNICTFFLSSDMKVVYYIAGYWAPEPFLEILEAVEKLHAAAEVTDRARVHGEVVADLSGRMGADKAPPQALSAGCRYEKVEHRHGPGCAPILAESIRCRAAVHESLRDAGPVDFEKVQHKYLYGNTFTEEAQAAPPVPFEKPLTPVRAAPR